MESGEQVALFDFDGILFSPESRWKIRNPRLGVLGSGIAPDRMHHLFREILDEDPGTSILDHFSFDHFEVQGHPLEDGINLLPPESIIPTARDHLGRRRELYILSSRPYRGLAGVTGPLYEEYKSTNGREDHFTRSNPFLGKKVLTPDSRESLEDPIGAKVAALRNVLMKAGESDENENDSRRRFSRIFLYLSEEDFLRAVKEFLEQYGEVLPEGRNSIVPVMIARPL